MANIFLTKKCNLKCQYCFADEFVNKSNEEYTIEDFKKVVSFIKTNKEEKIGLIGGEPTLYPYFKEVLSILNEDKDIENYIIYTNGIEIDKYINEIINSKVQLLINCNSPKDIGRNFDKLKENINLLVSKNFFDFTLGINLYSSDLDYNYIFELLEIAKKHNLRFSTALPNSNKENTVNALENFIEFKPYLFSFLNDCCSREIIPTNDCNAIPSCLLDNKDKQLLIRMKILADKYKLPSTIITNRTCSPVIDILPGLEAVRCFGFSKSLRVPISKFKNIQSMRRYFYNMIDIYASLSFETKECEACTSRLYDKCGLCYTYKMRKIDELKKFIISHAS